MKKAILIVGIILAVAAISAGSFWGGMKYQESQASQAQANFFAARGQGQSGTIPGNGQFQGNGQIPADRQGTFFRNGGGTVGQIKSINGGMITLSTAENVTTINLTSDTVIKQTVTASLNDLQPGMRVTVIGKKDNDGNITAAQIQVVDESMLQNMPAPSETQMAP